MKEYEHFEQVAFFELVNLKLIKKYPFLEKLLFAVPNGGHRSKTQGGKLKAEGVKRGVSDILLLLPARGYNFLCIEMKHGTNKQDEEQGKFEKFAEVTGKGIYQLSYSGNDAFNILVWYLKGWENE
jgi:hypothetical protein